jgi:hypothetical protein
MQVSWAGTATISLIWSRFCETVSDGNEGKTQKWSYCSGIHKGQIVRIFTFWASVIFGQVFLNKKCPLLKSYVFILTKNGMGHILGYFLTNSSGHPDLELAAIV